MAKAKAPLELNIKDWLLEAKASGEFVKVLVVLGPDETPFYLTGHWERLVAFFHEAQDKVLDLAPRSQVDNAGEFPKEISVEPEVP
jgi:hypothetical protein